MIFRFGPLEVDEERFELRRHGKVVGVQRRVLDTILYLVKSGGRLVTKDDLIKGPWQGTMVTDAAFSQAIMLARRALADPKYPKTFIATVRGKGFRFDGAASADRHDVPGAGWAPLTMAYRGQLPGPPEITPRAESKVEPDVPLGDALSRRKRRSHPSGIRSPLREEMIVAQRMSAVAHRRGDRARLLDAHLWRAQCLLEVGDRANFVRATAEHDGLARATGHPAHLWYAAVLASTRCHQDAKIAAAEKLIGDHLRLGMAAVGPAAEGTAAAHFLNLAFEMRGPARAKALRRSLGLGQRCAEREPDVFIWRSLSAVACLQLGNPIRARSLFQKLARQASRLPDDRALVPSLVNFIDLLIAFRDWRRLRAVYERMLPYDGIRVCYELSDWGPVSFHLGRASRELGEAAVSHRHFARAIDESESAGAVCWKAWAQYACARALADTGRRDDARRAVALLRRTADAARRFDMAALRQASSSLGQPPSPTSFLATGAVGAAKKRRRRHDD